jgi:hypothetical protein
MAENLVEFMRKKCWERGEARRLLMQLSSSTIDDCDLLRILDEIAAYCLGETDELPALLPH